MEALGARHRPLNVSTLGQVFTPPAVVQHMLALRQNSGSVLEPSCGDGAFSRHIPGCLSIEKDPLICPLGALNCDFFSYVPNGTFDTIIGNPPYVRHQDIDPGTRARLEMTFFDGRANLYLFFIKRCVELLRPGGELIFITPRDFLKATSARKLNEWLHQEGTFTHIEDLGDTRTFPDASPNCVIFRYVRGEHSHRTADGRIQVLSDGQLLFLDSLPMLRVCDLFDVKVGAVSGADALFAHPEGNRDFVCSRTASHGETRRMIYRTEVPALLPHKAALLARRIRRFDESNWWDWGRAYPETDAARIYVNAKTRAERPFFLHPVTAFDGSVLALFPRSPKMELEEWVDRLNGLDWAALGFRSGGRFLFSQRALENCPLPL